MADPLILALGGTRSGKSRFGLAAATRLAGEGGRVWFLATAWPGDPELDDRIARHRAARPAAWPTIEVGTDLVAALAATAADEPVLVDGLTLWLSTLLGDDVPGHRSDPRRSGGRRTRGDRRAAGSRDRGQRRGRLGIVPMHAGARAYRDLVGITHQRLAALADEAYLLVAGLPVTLKGGREIVTGPREDEARLRSRPGGRRAARRGRDGRRGRASGPADEATREPRPARGAGHPAGGHHRACRRVRRRPGDRRGRGRSRRRAPRRLGLSGRGDRPDGRQLRRRGSGHQRPRGGGRRPGRGRRRRRRRPDPRRRSRSRFAAARWSAPASGPGRPT